MVDKKVVPEVKEEIKYPDYKIEILRDFDGKIDPFYLSKKDPDYEYRFLNVKSENLTIKTSNLLFQKGGWQLCPKEHLLRVGIKERELSADGFYRVGNELVLAFMPKEYYNEKMKEKSKQANEPMDAVKRLLKEGDKSIGGVDMHPTMRGIEPQKKLGGNWKE